MNEQRLKNWLNANFKLKKDVKSIRNKQFYTFSRPNEIDDLKFSVATILNCYNEHNNDVAQEAEFIDALKKYGVHVTPTNDRNAVKYLITNMVQILYLK